MIGAFYIFTEFIRHQLRFNADLRPVGLDHFRHQTGIGILAWLRMVPEVNRESLWITRLLKQGLRFRHMTIETAASERRPVVRGLQRRFEGALFYRWPCRARAAPVRHSAVYAKRYRPV